MAWKYIMLQSEIGTTKILHPIIFPDVLVHRDVAMALRTACPGWHHEGVRALSAGTINSVEALGVGGNSETLGLSARDDDRNIITTLPYLHGIRGASPELVRRTLGAIRSRRGGDEHNSF